MLSDAQERSTVTSKVDELERLAETGDSPATPLVLLGEVWLVCVIAVLVLLALALFAYRLAS